MRPAWVRQTIYFLKEVLNEIQGEANRQGQGLSWCVQQAWCIARTEVLHFTSIEIAPLADPAESNRDVDDIGGVWGAHRAAAPRRIDRTLASDSTRL